MPRPWTSETKRAAHPLAKRSNSILSEEAVYAMGALAGDPRAHAHYMELNNEDVARRATSCVSAQEYSCAVCAWIEFIKNSHIFDFLSLVTRSPCKVSSSSSRGTSIGTPGALIGFIPTKTALPCLFNTPRPYFFD
jgi:hypothetical protein